VPSLSPPACGNADDLMKLLATICAAVLPILALAFRWFLLKTDVRIGYVWKWQGADFHPSFDIRNLSRSKTYVLGNIAYTKNHGQEILVFDNKSLWGKELKPGTITYSEAAPVPKINSIGECPEVEVKIRLQNGREFRDRVRANYTKAFAGPHLR
jgi:hypothetical protein